MPPEPSRPTMRYGPIFMGSLTGVRTPPTSFRGPVQDVRSVPRNPRFFSRSGTGGTPGTKKPGSRADVRETPAGAVTAADRRNGRRSGQLGSAAEWGGASAQAL